MTYVYRDGDSCAEHGFVLSPDGSCLRCKNEAIEADRRSFSRKVTAGVVLVSVLTVGGAWAHVRNARAAAQPETAAVAPVAPLPEPIVDPSAPTVVEDEPRSPTIAPDTHAVLDAWQAELARAEARRAAQLAAESAKTGAIERQRREEALDTATPVVSGSQGRGHVRRNPSSTDDNSSWWQDQPVARHVGSIAGQQRAMAAAGVPTNLTNPNPSAWLPPNNGGHFGTKTGPGH
jgi:hypothetical protein